MASKMRLSSYNIHKARVAELLVLAKLKGRQKPHLLLYGPPGTGKTTLARLYVEHHNVPAYNVLRLNASNTRGIDTVRSTIMEFVKYPSLSRTTKFVILDEADYLTNDAQAALREIMEQYRQNNNFILICNNLSKITAPIRSRCTALAFPALTPGESRVVFNNLQKQAGMVFKDEEIDKLIQFAKGDIRYLRNHLAVEPSPQLDFSQFWAKSDNEIFNMSKTPGNAKACMQACLVQLVNKGGRVSADAICVLADCDLAIAQGASQSTQLVALAIRLRRLLAAGGA